MDFSRPGQAQLICVQPVGLTRGVNVAGQQMGGKKEQGCWSVTRAPWAESQEGAFSRCGQRGL